MNKTMPSTTPYGQRPYTASQNSFGKPRYSRVPKYVAVIGLAAVFGAGAATGWYAHKWRVDQAFNAGYSSARQVLKENVKTDASLLEKRVEKESTTAPNQR